jgi:hypothetical protein
MPLKSELLLATPPTFHRGLHRFALVLSAAIFLLIVAGFGFAAYLTRVVWGRNAVQPLPSMVSTTVSQAAIGALLLVTSFVLGEQVRRHLLTAPVSIPDTEPARRAIRA